MKQDSRSTRYTAQRASAFDIRALLPLGAMLASLAVVAYACLVTDDSLIQARIIREGMSLIVLVWVAGLLASLVRLGAVRSGSRTFDVELAP